MIKRFRRNGPIPCHRILNISIHSSNAEIKKPALAQTQMRAQQYLYLGSKIGFFGLFCLGESEPISARSINHLVNGFPENLRESLA